MRFSLILGAAILAQPAGASTMQPAVGIPLQQAEVLIGKQDYHAALLKVDEAGAVKSLTPDESLAIAQLRGAAAAGAGDYTQAASAYETVLNTGQKPAAAQTQLVQAIAGFYYQAGDFPKTILWAGRYIQAHGGDPRTRALLAQAYYQQGDYTHAEQAAQRDVAAAHTAPLEGELQLLASSAQKSGDQPGYAAALQTLLRTYPKPEYWAEAIELVTAAPDFPDRLTLDVYRLRLATNTLTAPADYEDYAERAILAGRPDEAKSVIGTGFSSGILTAQTDAGHAARLRMLADKNAGDTAPSTLQENADSPLDRGIAEAATGNSGQAIKDLQSVDGYAAPPLSNPEGDLARLWTIQIENRSKQNRMPS